MTRQQRGLRTIQALAQSAETIRSRAVADRRSNLQRELQRLEQLEQYRSEYQALSTADDGAISIHLVRGRRGFVHRLGDAIENQRAAVQTAARQLEAHLDEWQRARSKSRSLQKYADRLSAEETRREDRQQQKELDEIGRRR